MTHPVLSLGAAPDLLSPRRRRPRRLRPGVGRLDDPAPRNPPAEARRRSGGQGRRPRRPRLHRLQRRHELALRGRLPRHGRHRRACRDVRRRRTGPLRDRADGAAEPGHPGRPGPARDPGLGDHRSAGDPRLRRERSRRRHRPGLRRPGHGGHAVAPGHGNRAASPHPWRRLPRAARRPGAGGARTAAVPPRHRRPRPRRRADHPGPGHHPRGRPGRPPRRAHPERRESWRGRRLARRLSKAVARASVGTDPSSARSCSISSPPADTRSPSPRSRSSPWSPRHATITAATVPAQQTRKHRSPKPVPTVPASRRTGTGDRASRGPRTENCDVSAPAVAGTEGDDTGTKAPSVSAVPGPSPSNRTPARDRRRRGDRRSCCRSACSSG